MRRTPTGSVTRPARKTGLWWGYGAADLTLARPRAGDGAATITILAVTLVAALPGRFIVPSACVDLCDALGARKDGLKCVFLFGVHFVQDGIGVFESTLATELADNVGDVGEFVS